MTREGFNKMIGAQLKTLRKERGVSRKDIAKHLEISVDSVGKIERGERPIFAHDLTKWVLYLNASVTIGGEITVPNTISLQHKRPEG